MQIAIRLLVLGIIDSCIGIGCRLGCVAHFFYQELETKSNVSAHLLGGLARHVVEALGNHLSHDLGVDQLFVAFPGFR